MGCSFLWTEVDHSSHVSFISFIAGMLWAPLPKFIWVGCNCCNDRDDDHTDIVQYL